jgi:hypothetical protein
MTPIKAGDPKKIRQLGKQLVKELTARSSTLRTQFDKAGTSDKDKEILHLKISIIEDLVDDLGLHVCNPPHGSVGLSKKTLPTPGCPTGTID